MANEWHLHVSPSIFIESRLTRDFTFFSIFNVVYSFLTFGTKTNVITTAN